MARCRGFRRKLPHPSSPSSRSETGVGGAGNVARNIAALGAHCILVGLVGEDDAGNAPLGAGLAREPLIECVLVRELDPADDTKGAVRVRALLHTHVARRLGAGDARLGCHRAETDRCHSAVAAARRHRFDVRLCQGHVDGPRRSQPDRHGAQLGKPVIVDPKSANLAIYRGATLLKPNRREFAEATRSRADTDGDIAEAAQDVMQLADCEAVLVTQSEKGMTLVRRGAGAIHVPGHPVRVRDVSGAGDTVAAVLAVAMAAGADWEAALRMANAAAAVAVSKIGVAVVTLAELRRRILPHASLAVEEKIVTDAELEAVLRDWRKQDLRIGFTNGCFDILHPGHVRLLTGARASCDRLIVGLNSDASVRRLKGNGRPVQNEHARSEVLAALEAVDLVVLFDEDTPIRLITQIGPNVLIKGSDYTREQVVGHEVVEAGGGEVRLIEILPGFSTTSLVDRARGSGK